MGIRDIAQLPRMILRHLHPGPSINALKEFAGRGIINPHAPVSAKAEATIAAPAQDVWRVISDAASWHNWHPAVRVLDPATQLSSCGQFVWKSNGFTVRSEVVWVEENREVCWVGKAMGTKAVHAWRLRELGPDLTLIQTEESMDGSLINFIYSRTKLKEFLVQWLKYLKTECERPRQ